METNPVDGPEVRRFRDSLRGELILPESPRYHHARRTWNGLVDKRPALIAQCAAAGDVVRSVQFARDHELLVSVRGGGHNIAGHSVCDGG